VDAKARARKPGAAATADEEEPELPKSIEEGADAVEGDYM
jgi:hypothetical protein